MATEEQRIAARGSIIRDVLAERLRQRETGKKDSLSPERWLVVEGEEIGEVAKAVLEGLDENYYDEWIQVMAVALAALEDFKLKGCKL